MANFPALPLFVDAYLADTRLLNCRESGAYLHLLMSAWLLPDGGLPTDDRNLATYARCTLREWHKIKDVVLKFWTLCDDGKLRQKRLEKEREAVQTRSEKSRQSAHARWERSKNGSNSVQNRSKNGSRLDPVENDNPLENIDVGYAFASSEHIHPTQPNPKEEEKYTSYTSLRAREAGSGNLFSEPETQPNPSPSPSSAVPQTEAVPGGKTPHPRSAAPLPSENASVAPPANAAASCAAPKRRRSRKPKAPPPQPDAKFEEFWAANLVQEGWGPALEAWQVAITKAPPDEIIAAAKRYADKRIAEIAAGDLPKWTKQPKNWLHEERWRDRPAPARVIDQEGRPDMQHQVNGQRMSAGTASIERKRQILREMGALS